MERRCCLSTGVENAVTKVKATTVLTTLLKAGFAPWCFIVNLSDLAERHFFFTTIAFRRASDKSFARLNSKPFFFGDKLVHVY